MGDSESNRRKLRHIVHFSESLAKDHGFQDEFFGAKFPALAQPLIRRLLSLDPAQRLDLAAAGEPGGGGAGEGDGAGGAWRGIKADAFFGGIDFGALATQTPPDFSSGIVSADMASVCGCVGV